MTKTVRTKKSEDMQRGSPDHQSEALPHLMGLPDKLLGIRMDTQVRLLGRASFLDPWRGMQVEQSDFQRVLNQAGQQAPVTEISVAGTLADAMRAIEPLTQMAERLSLNKIDLDPPLITLRLIWICATNASMRIGKTT